MAQIQIRSIEDLLVFMVLAGNDPNMWAAVDTASLKVVIPIAVGGTFRDGRLDVYGAKFVADLQKQTHDAFRRYGGTTTGGRSNQLRVEVKDGSDWFDIDFTPAIVEAVHKMTPTQIIGTLVFCAVLGTGAYCYGKFKDAEIERIKADVEKCRVENQTLMMQQNNEHHERLMEQLLKSNKEIVAEAVALASRVAGRESQYGTDASKPIRKLVKNMRRGESLRSGDGEEFSKKEALERLVPLPPKDIVYHVHADGNYALNGVDLMEGRQGLRISQEDGTPTTGLLERLDDDIRESIVTKVDASMEAKTTLGMDLQVDVYFTQKKIVHAVIVGVGARRAGLRHWSLKDIPGEVPERDRLLQGEVD